MPDTESVLLVTNRKTPGKIGSLLLDVVLSTGHAFSNTISDYPVENGGNISDHVKRDPTVVTMTGFITNHPIDVLNTSSEETIKEVSDSQAKSLSKLSSNRVKAAFMELLQIVGEDYPEQPTSKTKILGKPKIVEIVTTYRVYSDMLMLRLDIPENPEDGESLRFTAQFKKINKVKAYRVLLPNARSIGSGAGNAPRVKDQATDKNKKGKVEGNELKSFLFRGGENAVPAVEKIFDWLDSLFLVKP